MKYILCLLLLVSFSSLANDLMTGHFTQSTVISFTKGESFKLTINDIEVQVSREVLFPRMGPLQSISIEKYLTNGKNKIVVSSSSKPINLEFVRTQIDPQGNVLESFHMLKEFNGEIEHHHLAPKADEKIQWDKAEKNKLYEVLQKYQRSLKSHNYGGYVINLAIEMKKLMRISSVSEAVLMRKEIERFREIAKKTKIWQVNLPEITELNCNLSNGSSRVNCDPALTIESSNGIFPLEISFQRINGTYVPAQATSGF